MGCANLNTERCHPRRCAADATGPPEYLHLLLTEGLSLHPDAVVVNVFVGNDLNYRPAGARVGLLASILDRRNFLLFQTPRRLRILVEEERDLPARAHTPLREEPARPITTPQELEREYPWVLDPLLEPSGFSEDRYMAIETERATAVTVQSEADYLLRFDPIEKMQRAAGSRPFLVMIIPDEFQVEDRLWDEICRRGSVALDRDRPRAIFVRWLQARGIAYLDLLPVLRAVEPMADGWRHVYRHHNTHFNVRGNEVVGRALAERLARALPR